jgi:hypothetical protein
MKLEFETPDDLNLYRGDKYTFENSTIRADSYRIYKAGKFYGNLKEGIVTGTTKLSEEEKLHIRNEARLIGIL